MHVTKDMHVHTNLSACADPDATLAKMAEAAEHLGIQTIGIANHVWDHLVPGASGWYAPQDVEHILKIHEEMAYISKPRILVGCEAEYIGNGILGLTPENATRLDYLLASFTHFHMKGFTISPDITEPKDVAELMMQRAFELIEHPTMNCGIPTGFAHLFCPCGCSNWLEIFEHLPSEKFRAFFKRVADKKISVGIHNCHCSEGPIHEHEVRMFTIAKECGCHFHFESDGHTFKDGDPEAICAEKYACHAKLADEVGITEADLWAI